MAIGIDELTPEEQSLYSQAQRKLRDALTSHSYFHAEPVRNPSGTLAAVKAFDKQDKPRRLLAEIDIQAGGKLQEVRTHV